MTPDYAYQLLGTALSVGLLLGGVVAIFNAWRT